MNPLTDLPHIGNFLSFVLKSKLSGFAILGKFNFQAKPGSGVHNNASLLDYVKTNYKRQKYNLLYYWNKCKKHRIQKMKILYQLFYNLFDAFFENIMI